MVNERDVSASASAIASASANAGGAPTVFAWTMTRWARLYSPLARHLKERHGIDTILFTYGEAELPGRERFGFHREDFLEVVDLEPLLAPTASDERLAAAEIAARAAELEERYGVNLIDLMRTDRHLGIDFVTGADFMRSRFGMSHDYPQTMELLLRICDRFEKLLLKYRPITVFAWPGSVAPAALVFLAEGMNIPMRALIVSRYGKNFHWMADKHGTPHGFAEAFERRNAATAGDGNADEGGPIVTEPPVRTRRTLDRFGYTASLRFYVSTLLRQMRTWAGNYVHGRRKVYGNYLKRDWLWLFTERWFWRRRALRESAVMPTLPPGLPYIFFPLHIEPESTVMVEAPMCDNQLTLIDWLAKSVPAGWYVVVKEHPGATAPRPAAFWKRVRAYPNVIVAATLEDADAVNAGARAIACISGTVGVQAALAGRPVITFHPKFIAQCMPHVLLATSYEETRAALRRVHFGDLPDRGARMRAARAFVAALDDCSFPFEDSGTQLGIPDEAKIDPVEIERAVDQLLASLGWTGAETDKAAQRVT